MRPLAILAILAAALSTPACVGGTIHGLDEAAWFELLARGGPLPMEAGEQVDYDALARLGEGAILFVAMRAQDDGDLALATAMFNEALRRESGRYRTRAAALLADVLLAARDGPGLVKLCQSEYGAELPPYRRMYLEAAGLVASASYAQVLATIDALRTAFPVEAGRDAAELAAWAAEAGYRAGRGRWVDEFSAIVAMEGSQKVYAALSTLVGLVTASSQSDAATAIRALGPRTFRLAQARALGGSREYGPAVVAFRRYATSAESPESIAATLGQSTPDTPDAIVAPVTPAVPAAVEAVQVPDPAAVPLSAEAAAALFLTLPRAAASDAARAFIAASRDEGANGFRHIVQTVLDRGADPSRVYFNAFWNARFLRAAEQWQDAETWFSKATALAATALERDAAAWYQVEATGKRSAAAAIAALGTAMAASRNPGYYSDLLEPLSRDALVARDGVALAALDAAVSAKAGPRDAARLAYLCARAAQVGIVTDAHVAAAFGRAYADRSAYADARMKAAYNQKADGWYRLAAAYRLGEPLVDSLTTPEPVLPAAPASSTEPAAPLESDTSAADSSAQDTGTPVVGPDEYALALARFGLGARVRSELGAEFTLLKPDTVRSVAETMQAAGRYDRAYRFIATLFWNSSFKPTRRDAELYWPRPYPEAFAAAAAATGLDEFLLYGLARSESAFDPAAVSKSGAIGLTQLMPATAAEMAARLKLAEYELTDPEDNLAIGSAYFARILNGVDGRVLPAVFSYNGGPTRFRRWEAEYGDLPLDLMLEALSYSETRQYGRNVASAALSYAALYGEGDIRAYFAWLLGESAQP